MTDGERDIILEALHRLEVRFTERLTRLEASIGGYADLAVSVKDLESRQNKLILAIILLAMAGAGSQWSNVIKLIA